MIGPVRRLGWFVRNVWRFRFALWSWRPWDWEYSYALFMRGLECMDVECGDPFWEWDEDTGERLSPDAMCGRPWDAYRLWEHYSHNWDKPDEREEAWRLLHEYLRDNARNWWT